MDSWSWRPSNSQLVITGVTLGTFAAIHYVYGIRLRWTNLSQTATTPHDSPTNEPLLQPTPSKIKILSQNIWCVFFKGGPQRHKRLKILVNAIRNHQPDIICLQEMHLLGLGFLLLCGDYLYVQQNLIEQGYIYHTNPKLSTPFFGSSSGCVTFSKYPIITSETKIFANIRSGRCKGWTYANISIPNIHNLKIVNTHLEHKNKQMQLDQMEEIAKYIDGKVNDLEDNNTSVLCMGDFNVCSNFTFGGNSYVSLCEQMEIVGLNIDLYSNTKRTYCKSMRRKGTQSLDHLFINEKHSKYVIESKLVDYRNEKRIMSDHLGMFTTFAF